MEKDHYSEKEAADTIRPIVDALRYCHTMGIAHRDLKVILFMTVGYIFSSLKIYYMPVRIKTQS